MSEHIWTYLNIYNHVWTCQIMSEHVWTRLNMSEHVWTRLNVSDRVWTYYSDSDSESESEPESLESEDELDDNLQSCPLFLLPSAPPSPPPAGSDPPLDPPGPEVPSGPPWAPRFWPASERFLRGFFFRDEATKCSNARKVEVFKVSKSISISSGLESRRAGSLCWMIWTTCNDIACYFKWDLSIWSIKAKILIPKIVKIVRQFYMLSTKIIFDLGFKLDIPWQCMFLNRVQKIWDAQIHVVKTLSCTVFWWPCLCLIK
jgi:hypothetical protein